MAEKGKEKEGRKNERKELKVGGKVRSELNFGEGKEGPNPEQEKKLTELRCGLSHNQQERDNLNTPPTVHLCW